MTMLLFIILFCVLLNETDAQARIALAKKHADATTRELIGREELFGARQP